MNSPNLLLPFLYNSESQLLRIKQMDMLKTSVGRRQPWEKSWNKAYSDVFELRVRWRHYRVSMTAAAVILLLVFKGGTHVSKILFCLFECPQSQAFQDKYGLSVRDTIKISINKMQIHKHFLKICSLISWLFPLQWKEHQRLWYLWWA